MFDRLGRDNHRGSVRHGNYSEKHDGNLLKKTLPKKV